ncbi:MAG: EAL domain-containing protein [Eubacteriales bacterium]|nr:EAL domain-containing protein [Eubacteriales bacterium]
MSSQKKHKRNKTKLFSTGNVFVAVFLGIALLIGTVLMAGNIRTNIRATSYESLRSVSAESAKSVTGILQSRIGYLRSLWIQLRDTPPDMREKVLLQHQERSSIYGFDWIGCADASGRDFKSNGEVANIKKGSLFQSSMQGNIGIALRPVLHPDGEKRDGIILSIPIYADGPDPVGCLYQSFSPENFSNLLEVGAFNGNAYVTLLGPDGMVLAATAKHVLNVGENVLERLGEKEENREYADSLEHSIRTMKGGEGFFRMKGSSWCCYYTPITLECGEATMNLGVLSVVPGSFVSQQTGRTFRLVLYLAGMVAATILMLGIWLYRSLRQNKKELERLAYRDILTGQDNYEAFKRDFEYLKDETGIFLICDLVDFKLINRYFGSDKGDLVLQEMGRLFVGMRGSDNLTARVSDDQFVFFFSSMKMNEAPEKCRELQGQVLSLLRHLKVRISSPVFGYCLVKGNKPIEWYRSRVMFAKNLAKQRGKLYWAYDEETAAELTETDQLLNTFEQAIREERLEVWYQPKYLVREKRIGGAEALVRWRGEDGELISPARFISLLEEYGKIAALDEYVFTKVCKMQKVWRDAGLDPVQVSVNLSRSSLVDASLPEKYRKIVEDTCGDQSLISLEITEDSVQKDVMDVIRAFREQGFFLLMDDFGKGSSNLANLRKDLFSGVKLDKSLVELVGTGDEGLLSGSMQMIHSLGMWITAEGVERQEEVSFLEETYCDDIQGYFYYRPMEDYSFAGLLKEAVSFYGGGRSQGILGASMGSRRSLPSGDDMGGRREEGGSANRRGPFPSGDGIGSRRVRVLL